MQAKYEINWKTGKLKNKVRRAIHIKGKDNKLKYHKRKQ